MADDHSADVAHQRPLLCLLTNNSGAGNFKAIKFSSLNCCCGQGTKAALHTNNGDDL
jgi:hypothetical protein